MTDKHKLSLFLGDRTADKYLSLESIRDKEFIIYGAGSGFYTFASFILDKFHIKPNLILDKSFENDDVFCGIKASAIDDFEPSDREKNHSVVIITVGSVKAYEDIKHELTAKIGFQHVIWAFDIFEYSLHHTPIAYINNIQTEMSNRFDKITEAYALFADDASKKMYKDILSIYYFGRKELLSSRPISEQYFPHDIELKKGFGCFVDCGAYTGDTVAQLAARVDNVDTLICFEPDKVNYKQLSKNIDRKLAKRVISFPCALFNTEKKLKSSYNDSNSSISDDGDSTIQAVAIDHVLFGFNPSFIKMDIEGAELDALQGAQNTIKTNAPDLAISIYHLVEHLWLLPLLIHSFGVNYKFYLRNYTSHVSETVLYAKSME